MVLRSLKEGCHRTTVQLISRGTEFIIFDDKYITSVHVFDVFPNLDLLLCSGFSYLLRNVKKKNGFVCHHQTEVFSLYLI